LATATGRRSSPSCAATVSACGEPPRWDC
jgi:hypothetical protein